MRIGALVRSYGTTKYLRAVAKQYDWVDRLLIMNYRFNGVIPRQDGTRDILQELNQPNVEIMTGENFNQHEVFNLGFSMLKDCDYIFVSDSDEIITKQDQKKMVDGIEDYDAGVCNIIDYKTDYYHRIPQRTHKPLVLAKNTLKFYDVRCYTGRCKEFPINIHHFGFVNEEADIQWKFNWEKAWEGSTIGDLYGQPVLPCELPKDVEEMLNA